MAGPSPTEVLAEVGRALGADGRLVLCTIVRCSGSTPGKPGWRLALLRDGAAVGNLGGGSFEALVKADAAAKLADPGAASEVKRYYFTERATRGEPTGMVCGGLSEVFLEVMTAPPVLVVCGGGPVGQALARAGELAGFEPLVVEDRAEFRRPELFPEGTRFAAVDRGYGGDFLAPWSRRDLHVAIVTRCWETDAAALAGVLAQAPANLRYLGLMGSARKIERVRREVEAAGHPLAGVDLKAPIGLPVGGDTPGEIAIAIVAEILACRAREAGAARGSAAAHGSGDEAAAEAAEDEAPAAAGVEAAETEFADPPGVVRF
jgi:xanthine dehydrogenase accessory factor